MSVRSPASQRLELASGSTSELAGLVEKVSRDDTRLLVEQSGVVVAAIVSADDLARLVRFDAERERRRQLLARTRRPFAQISPEQIERDVAAVIAEVRAEDEAKIHAEEHVSVERRPA